jgi:hypothetical protein
MSDGDGSSVVQFQLVQSARSAKVRFSIELLVLLVRDMGECCHRILDCAFVASKSEPDMRSVTVKILLETFVFR